TLLPNNSRHAHSRNSLHVPSSASACEFRISLILVAPVSQAHLQDDHGRSPTRRAFPGRRRISLPPRLAKFVFARCRACRFLPFGRPTPSEGLSPGRHRRFSASRSGSRRHGSRFPKPPRESRQPSELLAFDFCRCLAVAGGCCPMVDLRTLVPAARP